ncbi:MAG TPA: hypothetical protein VGO21_01260 [Candidatus Paceibacterota bacterium]|jgi:hypothetical protein|nr:hypothetical protein [Candidatus Paceibacterota bacterium]
MKTLVLAFTSLVILANAQPLTKPDTSSANVSSVATAVVPDCPASVCLLSSDGVVTPLKTERPVHNVAKKWLGFKGGEVAYVFVGASASAKATSNPVFIVVGLGAGELDRQVNLDRLVADGEVRKIVTISRRGILGGKSAETPGPVELRLEKGFVVPTEPLTTGEYVLSTKGGSMYTFRVE